MKIGFAHRSAGFEVCGIAGFQPAGARIFPARFPVERTAGLETGDTAGLETCATRIQL
jgi:hypothetical protein